MNSRKGILLVFFLIPVLQTTHTTPATYSIAIPDRLTIHLSHEATQRLARLAHETLWGFACLGIVFTGLHLAQNGIKELLAIQNKETEMTYSKTKLTLKTGIGITTTLVALFLLQFPHGENI